MIERVILGIVAVAFGFGLRIFIDKKRNKSGMKDLKISPLVYVGLLIIVIILANYYWD